MTTVLATTFSPRGLRIAIPVLVAGLVLAGVLCSAFEERSAWDGVWWAVTTVTTVGDGTFSPATVPGRLIGIAVMVLGIGFLLVLAGALVEHFVRQEERVLVPPEQAALARLDVIDARLAAIEAHLTELRRQVAPTRNDGT
jgi:hypothetical protein